MTNENEYPQKMKQILEELRVEKDKNQKLREANKNFDKASKLYIEKLVSLEQ